MITLLLIFHCCPNTLSQTQTFTKTLQVYCLRILLVRSVMGLDGFLAQHLTGVKLVSTVQSFLETLEPNPLSRSCRLLCQKSVPCDCRTNVPIPYGCQPEFLLIFYKLRPYPLPWYSSSIAKSAMKHCVLICHVSLTSTSAPFLLCSFFGRSAAPLGMVFSLHFLILVAHGNTPG